MYEKQLWNDVVEVHTTVEEFSNLYKTHTIKEMAEIYGVPFATISRWITVLGLRKRTYTRRNSVN